MATSAHLVHRFALATLVVLGCGRSASAPSIATVPPAATPSAPEAEPRPETPEPAPAAPESPPVDAADPDVRSPEVTMSTAAESEIAPEPSALEQLGGDYRYVGGAEQRKGIARAIEAVTEEMSILVRGIANDRLKKTNDAPQAISIREEGEEIVVKIDKQTYRGRIDGPAVVVPNVEGGTSKMRFEVRDGKLYQHFAANEGQRTNVFAPYPNGKRLNMWVTVRSPRLPKPVKYHLTYAQ